MFLLQRQGSVQDVLFYRVELCCSTLIGTLTLIQGGTYGADPSVKSKQHSCISHVGGRGAGPVTPPPSTHTHTRTLQLVCQIFLVAFQQSFQQTDNFMLRDALAAGCV